MNTIRDDIAAYLAAVRSSYPRGIPHSVIARPLVFHSTVSLASEAVQFVHDIAQKGLKLSPHRYVITDGALSDGPAVIFGSTGDRHRTLYAPSVQELMSDSDKKKIFWGALKAFAKAGYE